MKKEDLKQVISRDAHCFGCSQKNHYGLKMKFYTDETTLYSWLRTPPHLCGWGGIVHGGVLSTMLDEIMGWSAIYTLRKVVMTKTMTVDYLKPVYIEDKLRVEGKIVEWVNNREVIIEGKLYRDENVLCAQSRGAFAVFSAKTIKRMKILPQGVLAGFNEYLDE